MRYISIDSAQPGMIVGKSIYNEQGSILVNYRVKLTERLILRMRDIGLAGLYIEDEMSSDITVEDLISDELGVKATKALTKLDIDAALKVASDITEELNEKMQRKRRTDCRHGGRICRKGTVHGNCDLADSDSEPSAGADGGKDGSVPDDLFRDAACDFPDRKRVCIYSLDSVEKSGKIGKRDSDGGAGEKILLRVFV